MSTNTAEYRREYYRKNRERILASNKTSKLKHSHRWKRLRLRRCYDCGISFANQLHHIGKKVILCRYCFSALQSSKEEKPNCASVVDREYELPTVHDLDLKENVLAMLNTLTRRERATILLRFGFLEYSFTLDEVAEFMNISRERVRQLEAKALRMLRHPDRLRMIDANTPDATPRQ